jgi:hypothetical protein
MCWAVDVMCQFTCLRDCPNACCSDHMVGAVFFSSMEPSCRKGVFVGFLRALGRCG